MARVSDDHAGECFNVRHLAARQQPVGSSAPLVPRPILPQEVQQHGGRDGSYWVVIDGFVVDASEFIDAHPGGLRKLLAADHPDTGATGHAFGFSFSRGKNAHFPDTGKRFSEGVRRYLGGGSDGNSYLLPKEVAFPPYGKLVILGKLG